MLAESFSESDDVTSVESTDHQVLENESLQTWIFWSVDWLEFSLEEEMVL